MAAVQNVGIVGAGAAGLAAAILLADDCAADGVYEFWLSAEPLPITGAVGSPIAPVAVK